MFFKKLDLHGFKSFGHKTTIDFQEGFTIVVGPNGCGKSNVLDSIKWVLGTQSAKSLRGEKMGDVIFRGSQSTRAAGLSNVTLTLANDAGQLKVDQAEVAVTRRLYANGDSEYKINKKNCRMRDVHELFLDTGLGADGYSIIEQNQIGQMVSAKPRERREIFEEAAGISRYKLRRDETVRKLTRTTEDLIRLEDMVNEVERQCNSLRNQARKAKRHRRLSRRLHRLQQRLFVMRHTDLKGKYTLASEDLKVKEKAFEEVLTACGQAEAKSAEFQEKWEKSQNELQQLQQKRHQIQRERDAQRHQIELYQNKIKSINERIESLKRETESRRSRAKILGETLKALDLDFERDQQQHAEGEIVLRQKTEQLNALRQKANSAREELSAKQTEVRQLQAQRSAVENDERLAQSLVERLTTELEQTTENLNQLQEKVQLIDGQWEAAKKLVETTRNELDELRRESREIQEKIKADDQAKNELGQKVDHISRELSRSSSRLLALKELEDSYAGYFQGVKEVMKAADRGQIKGMIGVISSLIEVPKKLELAIEVTLGGDIQDIVSYTANDAKQAIQFLKQNNLGRATFLPLDLIHTDFPTHHLQKIWGRPGILGLGKDLITFDPKIEKAVQNLFGSTVIVEELDVAIGLEREGVRNRFVSLQGDVVNPRGVLSGGSHKSRGLLTRQREIRGLQDESDRLEGELKALQDEMAQAKDRLSGLYGRAAELQSLIHKAEITLSSGNKDLESAERDRKDRRNQLAQYEARSTQQRIDLQKQKETIETSQVSLEDLVTRLENAEAALKQTETDNSDLLEQNRLASEEVAVLREKQTSAADSLEVTRKRLDEMKTQIGESESDQQSKMAEQEQLENTLLEARVAIEESEVSLHEFSESFDEADQAVNTLMQDNEVFQQSMREHNSNTQRLTRDKNEKDNQLREVQVQTAELKAQLEYLEREVEDEFALTIDDVRKELTEAEEADRQRKEAQEQAKIEAARIAAEKKAQPKEEPKPEPTAEEQQEAAPNGDAPAETAEGDQPSEAEAQPDSEDPQTTEEAPAVQAAPAAEAQEDSDDTDDDGPVTTPEDDEADSPAKLRSIVNDLRQKLQRMGSVNEEAIEEYAQQFERFQFISTQRDDLASAKTQLEEAIARIDETTTKMFHEALDSIRENFKIMYSRLFNGGEADLILVQDEKEPEPGIDIYAVPPGKKIGGSITLLSGGEKALTAIALMFALFQFRPSPICILDEIDAPLDDVNCHRMCQVLKEYARDTQFLIITHNKITMGLADTIYGVTMQEAGVSKVVSVKFEDVEESGLLEETTV